MALTKFLILAFVVTLVFLRLRRAIRAIRAHLEATRSAMAAPGQGELRSVDLVACMGCGEAVPQSRTSSVGGRLLCNRCGLDTSPGE